MSSRLLALDSSLMRFRCREDMQFGIIFLRDSMVHPSHSEPSYVVHALELVKQSGLKSCTLFASFVSEQTGQVGFGFDGSSSSQETGKRALGMFDSALNKPVSLELLLEELQTISEGAANRKGLGLKGQFSRRQGI